MKTDAIARKLAFEAKLEYVHKGSQPGTGIACVVGADEKYHYTCNIYRDQVISSMVIFVVDEDQEWIWQCIYELVDGELFVDRRFRFEKSAPPEQFWEMVDRLMNAGEEFMKIFSPYPPGRKRD